MHRASALYDFALILAPVWAHTKIILCAGVCVFGLNLWKMTRCSFGAVSKRRVIGAAYTKYIHKSNKASATTFACCHLISLIPHAFIRRREQKSDLCTLNFGGVFVSHADWR